MRGGNKTVKKIFSLGIALIMLVFSLSFGVSAESLFGGVIDPGGHLTSEESQRITLKAQNAVRETGMNIIIYVCDNVGGDKSDYGVMDHADVTYESICGKNTDGILLLINLDNKFDYISTSGVAINYFSDYRIDKMFDMFWDDLVAQRYADAACGFVDSVLYYYRQGKANHQTEIAGREVEPEDFAALLLGSMIFALIIGIVIYTGNQKRYKLQKASTKEYIVNGSLLLNQRTDTFVKTIVNRVYSPRNTGSSGGGGSRSHSSTHHSSGGGRHGGGGRHR